MMSRFKRILAFLLAAVIVQGLALLFLTPGGLELLYPIPLRINAEKFKTSNNTYAVYYDTRKQISEADLVVIGIDGEVAESYDLLGHFSRFLKQYNNFSAVLLNFDRISERMADGVMDETDESQFYSRLEILKSSGFSQDICDYLSELFVINRTMAPLRKFKVISYSAVKDTEVMTLADMISDTYAACERSALCIVDAEALASGSTFRQELEQALSDKKIVCMKTVYTGSSPNEDGHETVVFPLTGSESAVYFVNNQNLSIFYEYTGSESAVYFVNNQNLSIFYEYYRKVTGLFGDSFALDNRLDNRYTDYFFVVANGTETEYISEGGITES